MKIRDLAGWPRAVLACGLLALASWTPPATAARSGDTTPPHVESISRLDPSPTNAGAVRYPVQFSEGVNGVDTTAFDLASTGSARGVIQAASGGGKRDEVRVSDLGGTGTLRLDLRDGTNIGNAAGDRPPGYTGGQLYEIDHDPPAVTSVSVPAAGRYAPGDALVFTVHLDEATFVDTTGGTPGLLLVLDTGGTVTAAYRSGSGTTALDFAYWVTPGNRDDDGPSLRPYIDLNGGTVRDAAGNDMVLTLVGIGSTAGVLIGQQSQTVNFGPQAARTFVPGGSFLLDPVATASSGLPVDYSSATASVCTISGSTVTMHAAGTCTIAAGQPGDGDYAAAPTVTQDIAIGQASQTIAFGAQAPQVFVAGGSFALSPLAAASSGLPVDYSSATASACTIGGITVTMHAAGTCTIAAGQPGNGDYAAAGAVTQNIAIGQARQTIQQFIADPAAPVFAPNGSFSVSARGGASGNPVVFATTTPAICSVAGRTVTMLSAGTCRLTADQAGNGDYAAATQVQLVVAIGGAQQTIRFDAQPARSFVAGGTFVLDPPATASSGLPVVHDSRTADVCTVADGTVTMHSAGTCTIAAAQAGDARHAAASTLVQSILIGKAAQAITGFAANPGAPTFAEGGTFTVSATGGASGLPVVFASTTPAVCRVDGGTVAMLAAGTCALTANQDGDAAHAAAPPLALDVTIAAATPTLAWVDTLHKILGEAAFDLPEPSSNSAGGFSFESSDPLVATISGRTVALVGSGAATLVATQAAAGGYGAGSVSLTLTVSARPDPTLDPEVVGGLQAQVDASVRFAHAQQDNIRDRLRLLRDGQGNPSTNRIGFSAMSAFGPGLSVGADQLPGSLPRLDQGWGVWMAGTITMGERDARQGASGFDFRSDGISLGVDRQLGRHLVMGVTGGLGWNHTDFERSTSRQEARQRSVALYGLWQDEGPVFVDGQLGMGRLDFDLWRWSAAAEATAQARREGEQWFGGLSLGYAHAHERARVAAYGRYDMSRTRLDPYRETGLGLLDLAYERQTVDSRTVAVGVEGSHPIGTTRAALRPFWSVEYRKALEHRGDAMLNYALQPVQHDYLLGLRSYNDDALALGTGLEVATDTGWRWSFLLRREQSSQGSANSLGLRVSYGQAPAQAPAWRGTGETPGAAPTRLAHPPGAPLPGR